MSLKAMAVKNSGECEVHGKPSRAAHRMLLFMVAASCCFIVWHVWVYGPTEQSSGKELLQRPFLYLLGREMWALLFDSHGILAELWDVLPYFIAGILLAGYIRTYKIAVKLQASLKRHGLLSVFFASLVGMITPLCACGTLTTAVSLLFARFPLAPVMALLVTSPLLSPSTYLLTLNDLGPEWTVIRTAAAFSMGMFAGVVTHMLRDRGFRTDSIFIEGAIPRGDFHDEAYPDERLRCNCKQKFGHRVAARTRNMFVIFLAKSSEMLWMVGKYVLAGVVIGAIVERYMPSKWVYGLFGQKGPFDILWVTLGSVPIFLHQISASSILHHVKSSLDGTLDGGAALAFMIGGPVTAMPTMVMFWTIFRKKVFFLYMFICLAGTLIISYAFQFLVFVPSVDLGNPLLKEVRSLSGGRTSILHKHNKNVRIVMDPDNKGMIATYHNAIEGSGGVVFDAGFGRFLNASAAGADNRRYIQNIAEWLEENNNSSDKNILIYNTFRNSGLDNTALGRDLFALLEGRGFKVRMTGRRESPEISERLMDGQSQLWVFFGDSGSHEAFSDAEMEALSKFSREGKGMLIVAGIQGNENRGMASVNQLASKYGVTYSGFADHKNELPASTASYFLNRASVAIGKVLKLVHKA